MGILTFLLTLLKIIGIVLLVVILFFIVVITLILTIPIKYNFRAEKTDKLYANLELTWFFKIIYFRYKINNKCKMVLLKIFGKTFYRDREIFNNSISQEYNVEETEFTKEPPLEETALNKEQVLERTEIDYPKEPEKNTKEKIKKTKVQKAKKQEQKINKDLEEGIEDIAKALENDAEEVVEENNIISKLDEYWNYPDREQIIKLSIKLMKRLIKTVLPKQLNLDLVIGTGDPALTGYILAWSSILVLLFGNDINILGNFERPALDGKVRIKGFIRIGKIFWNLLLFVISKPIRKLIWQYLKNRRKGD